jgi:hypothetical protein
MNEPYKSIALALQADSRLRHVLEYSGVDDEVHLCLVAALRDYFENIQDNVGLGPYAFLYNVTALVNAIVEDEADAELLQDLEVEE